MKTFNTYIFKRKISILRAATASHPPFHSGSTVNFYSQEKKTAVVEKENIKVSFSGDSLAFVTSQTLVS